jgi:DNA polymerase III gamma/tau subunit
MPTEAKELHRKYRPEFLNDVLGQIDVVKSLVKVIERDDVHCFIFDGPSGTGKTTLARIVAAELGCDDRTLLEIDAATNSGADAMRGIQEGLQYRPFGEARSRAIIIDECHSLSKQAWQTLLKGTEEPAAHVYWFFCTTEGGKIPPTMRTRGASYKLKAVRDDLLAKLCDQVVKAEKIKLAEGVHDLLIRSALGSPRQLLVNLAMVRDCETKRGAADALKVVLDSDATLKLCQALVGNKPSWAMMMGLLEDIGEANPEGVRIMVMRYLAKVAAGASSNAKAMAALEKMEAFERPYNDSEGLAPLLLSVGRAILS